jgi:putative ABC transport system permease protein
MSRTGFDEIRWAVRYARHRPLFACAVIVTLSVTIAAAATAFGLASSILWRELPFDDAGRLVFVWEEVERDGQRHPARVTAARHAAWRDTSNGLSALALFGAAGFTIETEGGTTSVRGVRVSADFFDTLGIRPALGRTFVPLDEAPESNRVVILSHGMWQERFGGRRDVVGETLRLSGQVHTVVGVMPAVTFPAWPVNPAVVTLDPGSRQLWVPIPRVAGFDQAANAHVFGVIGRMAPGVSEAEVLDRLNRTSVPSAPDPHRARLAPLREQFVAETRTPLLVLIAAALAVLLIGCTNLAALYASAFESRRAELAVRAAIGAGVARLTCQLAIETLALALLGALGGIILASVAMAMIPGLLPPSVPFLTMPALDLRVVAFAIGLAVIAGVILSAWPVSQLMLAAPSPRGVAVRPRSMVYRVLVVAQLTATVALVAAAVLLSQSLQSVRRQDTGFRVANTLVATVALPSSASTAEAIASAEQRLLAAVAARPNVRGVAFAYDHPLQANWSETLTLPGDAALPEERRPVELRIVSPGYFETLDVEPLDGRTFTERDTFTAPGVAVVNEAFVREFGGQVMGRRFRSGTPRFSFGDQAPQEFAIVGVVENERVRGLEQPALPAYYLSTRQFPQRSGALLVQTTGDSPAFAADIRAAVRALDPAISFDRPTSLEAILAEQLAQRRVTTSVIGGFGVAAIALAALGLYSLLAVLVGSRSREIGVRLAIGASPASVGLQVVRESVRNAIAGIALGCLLAIGTGRLLQGLLVGISPGDPVTLLFVAAVLLLVATAAAIVPARRASRVDPVVALRGD